MKRAIIILLTAVAGLILSVGLAAAATNTFTETFANAMYKDGGNTTADWNTSYGDLRLISNVNGQSNASVAKDASSNIIVVWNDDRDGANYVYAAKYNASGAKLWGDVRVIAGSYPKVACDSSNNIYIAYNPSTVTNGVYVRKLDTNGNLILQSGRLDNATYPEEWGAHDIAIDSSNYVYVAYTVYGPYGATVKASKINSSGTLLWGPVAANTTGSSDRGYDVSVAVGAGVLYVSHRDASPGELDVCRLYPSTGGKVWSSDLAVATGGRIRMTVDTAGNLCAVYNASYSSYYVKYNYNKTLLVSPKLVSNNGAMYLDKSDPDIAIDSSNNKYIVFTDRYDTGAGYDRTLRGQKLSSADSVLWASGGVKICRDDFIEQFGHDVCTDGNGGLFCTWLDNRINTKYKVYANRITSSGIRAWSTDITVAANIAKYSTSGRGQSLTVDTVTANITAATLTTNSALNSQTAVLYLTNNGGTNWYQVTSGVKYTFPVTGSDLRFRINLSTTNTATTPIIYDLTISYDYTTSTGGTGTFPYRMYWDTSWLNPLSGFMGSSNGTSVTCATNYTGTYYSGSNCTKFTYDRTKETWAGIYCLYNGWNGPGINLNGNKRLTFMAKSDVSGVKLTFGMGATSSSDTGAKSAVVTLSTTWTRVTLDLTAVNLSSINGLWYFSIAAADNPSITNPVTFYVDEVCYDEMSPTSQTSGLALAPDASFGEGETYVYPNPAKEGKNPTIHVEVGLADKIEINIYDVSGELVGDTAITDAPSISPNGNYAYEYQWNISGKPSGVYIARIIATKDSNNIKITKKFAVIK